MKIDPTIQFPTDPQSDRVSTTANKAVQSKPSAAASGADAASGEDTVRLSSTHGEVQALTAHLANVPEVRAQRVSALQQRVNGGTYHPESLKVADAIIADQVGRRQ
jgi:flagellar biosynthesis anti-sigma factor FlgM